MIDKLRAKVADMKREIDELRAQLKKERELNKELQTSAKGDLPSNSNSSSSSSAPPRNSGGSSNDKNNILFF